MIYLELILSVYILPSVTALPLLFRSSVTYDYDIGFTLINNYLDFS